MTDQKRPSTADAATRHADDRRRARFADQEIRFGRGGDTHQVAGGDVPALTTQQGMPVSDDQNSLKVGERGPTSLEDQHLREKRSSTSTTSGSPNGWSTPGLRRARLVRELRRPRSSSSVAMRHWPREQAVDQT